MSIHVKKYKIMIRLHVVVLPHSAAIYDFLHKMLHVNDDVFSDRLLLESTRSELPTH